MIFRVPVLLNYSPAKKFTGRIFFFVSLALIIYLGPQQLLPAQIEAGRAEYNTIMARENFRLGVNSFNYGFYNRAIVSLERSLALRPENSAAISWLGRSYYASGYVRLGLEQWQNLIEQNQATGILKSFYDTLDYRYRQISRLSSPDKFSLFMKLQSNKHKIKRSAYFVGPTAARAAEDRDGIYIVDYRDNKVVAIDASGATKFLWRGSLKQVYNRPFDILLRPKGEGFILSQEGSNSLLFCDEKGFPFKEVGEKGNGRGQFLGPQHLTDSGDGYFYVTDWGNRRIAKLDYDGNFIFTFGSAQKDFLGLQGPTGMVLRSNKIYVADTLQRQIFIFNQDGQYRETLISSGLTAPEALMLTRENNLLIADGNEIKLYDFASNSLSTIYTAAPKRKYIDLNYDRNKNIVAVDFNNEEIDFITPLSNLYTDLFVQINRIETSQYPQINVDLLVQDREGRAIVGLNRDNFQVIESDEVQKAELIYSSSNDQSVALAIILGSKLQHYKNAVRAMAQNASQRDNYTDSFMLLQGGKNPRVLSTSSQDINEQLDSYRELQGRDAAEANFDISLRFALDSLTRRRQKKIIVFVSGEPREIAAETYNVSDLKSYLQLANASMYALLADDDKIVSYLVANSQGKLYRDANVRNFGRDVQKQRAALTGHYSLSFTSNAYSDFARRYIPVALRAHYARRNGKDELGYFAPLSAINGKP